MLIPLNYTMCNLYYMNGLTNLNACRIFTSAFPAYLISYYF